MSARAELSCRELVERVTAYLEGDMSAAETAALESHLLECEGCEAYLDQFRWTIDALGGLREGGLDGATRMELLELFRGMRDARPARPDSG